MDLVKTKEDAAQKEADYQKQQKSTDDELGWE